MLNETLKALRKKKGFTQEEAAEKLHVVRQTISKWEKGLSVPDAEMLTALSELYEVSVGELLGAPAPEETPRDAQPDMQSLADQLARINEQLVIRNRRSRRIWKTVAAVLLTLLILYLAGIILSVAAFSAYRFDSTLSEETVTLEEFVSELDRSVP